MKIYEGKSINAGIAIGPIYFYEKGKYQINRETCSDISYEINRYETAKNIALQQINDIYEKTLLSLGEEHAMIFAAHKMMLEDETFSEIVLEAIEKEEVTAESAVLVAKEKLASMFSSMEDEYFKARAIDVVDISERVIHALRGEIPDAHILHEPSILLAQDLTPSETVQMQKNQLLAFVTKQGSSNSHTAILSRTMNLPALVGIRPLKKWDGKLAIVDGYTGRLIIEPDDSTLVQMKEKQYEIEEKRKLLQGLRGKEDMTLDHKNVKVYANIGSVEDVQDVILNDASGIGLFRSEFLFLQTKDYPTEEEQFQAYKSVVEKMNGKKVIIRTLDIGADKKIDYFHLKKEENPALGYRAIRICLDRIDVFKTQLRAIYRASVYGNVSMMYPMIISVEELHKIKQIVSEVKEELYKEGIAFNEIEQGIMIETPAAVMISDLLAKEVDFFSLGTNDLTQYTLVIDRQNSMLEAFYNPHHEAIFRMIQMVIENGHRENCWVGICGELASDQKVIKRLIQMGIDELSVSASYVLPIRKIVRETRMKE